MVRLWSTDTERILVYQLRFRLCHISPAIWRRLLIRSDQTLADLHHAIQISFDWDDAFLHRFRIHGHEYGMYRDGGVWFDAEPAAVQLHDLHFYRNERFTYEYNFISRWQVEVRVEAREPLTDERSYPRCVGGKRAGPPEDCGGAARFLALKDHYSLSYGWQLLHDIAYRQDEIEDMQWHRRELAAFQYWLHVDQFDRRRANQRLCLYAAGDECWRERDPRSHIDENQTATRDRT
jgi:hypothetical protein